MVKVDIAIGGRIDVVAGAKVSWEATLGAARVVVFGEIDCAVGVDALDPHDVAVGAGSVVSNGVWGGGVVDDVALALGGIAPVASVAPVGDIDTKVFLSFPAGVASTLADITADDDIANVVLRTTASPRIGIVAFADDTGTVVAGDFGGDFALHDFASVEGIAFVSSRIVFVFSNESRLLIATGGDLVTADLGAGDESIDAFFLAFEFFLE